MVVQVVGHRRKIAAGKQALDPLLKGGIDGQRVGERAVGRTGLFDLDLAVALENRRLDFADLAAAQDLEVVDAATECGRALP